MLDRELWNGHHKEVILPRDEDSASQALANLLQHSLVARDAFLRLAAPQWASRIDPSILRVDWQHRTHAGRRIDLLLHAGTFGLIIECKVGDKKKPYQLEHYHEYWLGRTGHRPQMAWLLQRDQKILGGGNSLARTVTWNQLSEAFSLVVDKGRDKKLLEEFCNQLRDASIVLSDSNTRSRKKLCKGYLQEHAESILTCILERVGDLRGSVEEVNECPPCLKAGRIAWMQKLRWPERVWLYMKPLNQTPNLKCPFGFKVDVPLFHHGKADSYEESVARLPQWMSVCTKHKLVFRRNRPGKWTGTVWLRAPINIPAKAGLRWFTASLPEDRELDTKFDWRNDAEAIEAGARHIQRFLKIVDEFR